MKTQSLLVSMVLLCGAGVAMADDPAMAPPAADPAMAPAAEPAPMPRTNVNSTVMGDAAGDAGDSRNATLSLDNRHGFEAGAPELVKATSQLQLTEQQKSKIHMAIEKSDAAAAMLIKRENAVRQMLAATTPDNPAYAKLKSEEASQDSLWNDNRESLRHAVADLLTPMQRSRFEQSQSRQ